MKETKKDTPQFLIDDEINRCRKGDAPSPISDAKLNSCYKSNGETYPLCKGEKDNKECKECNVYEAMKEPYDDI